MTSSSLSTAPAAAAALPAGTVARLDARLDGQARRPGDVGYDDGRRGWNLTVSQHPAVVVLARSEADVQTAVRFAAEHRLGVAVMSTGHGVVAPCDGGVLVNTSGMRQVRLDPATGRVRVAAGARWSDVLPVADAHGLAGPVGSSPGVGVVGFALGGGFGWLGRRYGLAAHHVTRARVVMADGRAVVAAPRTRPELFWALRGGTGNFGIVTALELQLVPLPQVYAGNLYYPLDRAREVLGLVAEWAATLPLELTAAVAFRAFPPLPTVPEPLRGNRFVTVRGAYAGDPDCGAVLVDRLRRALGPPRVDTFGRLSPATLGAVSLDPADPLRFQGHHDLLRDISSRLVDALVSLEGEGSASPLAMLEIRQLGGALEGSPDQLSPMAHTAAAYSLNAVGVTPSADQTHTVREHLTRVAEAARDDATGDAYLNFLDGTAGQSRVADAYTVTDLHRLRATKHRYDPANVFRFNRNVIHATKEQP